MLDGSKGEEDILDNEPGVCSVGGLRRGGGRAYSTCKGELAFYPAGHILGHGCGAGGRAITIGSLRSESSPTSNEGNL